MWAMSGRPCNPGSDFKGLWQVFLRDIPMPQCPARSDLQTADDKAALPEPALAEPTTNSAHDR
jgi:hypothetical protein